MGKKTLLTEIQVAKGGNQMQLTTKPKDGRGRGKGSGKGVGKGGRRTGPKDGSGPNKRCPKK